MRAKLWEFRAHCPELLSQRPERAPLGVVFRVVYGQELEHLGLF